MLNHDFITSVPIEESCQQVGSDTYEQFGKKETQIFVNQLHRLYPDLPFGMFIKVKACQHDFGTYHEAAVYYEDDSEERCDLALTIVDNPPEFWDEEALAELEEAGIPYDKGVDRSGVKDYRN